MKAQLSFVRGFFGLLVAAFMISGCGASQEQAGSTATVDIAPTLVAMTVDARRAARAAEQTQQAADNPTPAPPTHTPRPTRTPLVIATNTFTPRPPTDTPLITDTIPPTLSDYYFEDDFEGLKGWAIVNNENFIMEYSGGSYRIYVKMNTGDSPVFSVRSGVYGDIRVEVDIIRDDGPRDNFFGVLCRYQNPRNYYRFVVGRDGYYNIGKKLDGQFIDLGSGSESNAFHQGEGVNRVQAVCAGNTLILMLNGTKLLEVKDDSFTQGGVGLVVGTRSEKGADIYFDNFAISKP